MPIEDNEVKEIINNIDNGLKIDKCAEVKKPSQAEIELNKIVERDFFCFCREQDCQTCPYASTLYDHCDPANNEDLFVLED